MVKHFLVSQKRNKLGQHRQVIAETVANTFNQGQTTGRNIIYWENSWVDKRIIPKRDTEESNPAWMNDENLKLAIRNLIKKQGQRMYYIIISII